MKHLSTAGPLARPRLTAALAAAAFMLGACGTADGETPLERPGAEVRGGAIGPDVRVTEDLNLAQVQLEFPLDGLYEKGEDARMFFAVTNTGREPVVLSDISGPDFSDVEVQRADGEGLPLRIDGNDNLYVGAEGPPHVTLLDLDRSLRSSQSIPVTFTFADTSAVTVDVVVSAEGQTPTPPFDFPNDDPDQDPTGDDNTLPTRAAPTT
jgi:copper(I)-binding protein